MQICCYIRAGSPNPPLNPPRGAPRKLPTPNPAERSSRTSIVRPSYSKPLNMADRQGSDELSAVSGINPRYRAELKIKTYCILRISRSLENHHAITRGRAVWAKIDISSQDGTRGPEHVFQVLPADIEGQLNFVFRKVNDRPSARSKSRETTYTRDSQLLARLR